MPKKPTQPKKRPVPTSVYLRKEVRAEVEKIAEAEGLAVHAVMAYGVSYFVRQYKVGKARIELVNKPTLKLDV